MKRSLLVVFLLLIAGTTFAQSSYSAFLREEPEDFKSSLMGIIKGQNDGAWHDGAGQGIALSMLSIFGEDAKNWKEIIQNSSIGEINDLSGYEVARLHKETKTVGYWTRAPYKGEKALFYNGTPWISLYCGNPIKSTAQAPKQKQRRLIVEDDSAYDQPAQQSVVVKKEYQQGDSKVIVVNNTVPVPVQQVAQQAPQPVIIYQQPQMMQPTVMQQPMYQQAPPPVYYDNGPREVVVKTKPHWVDYVNLGLNAVDLGVDIYSAVRQDRYQRENRYAFSQIQNQLVRQQQQRRSTPRYRNDWPNESPYYPGYDNDPNDFQGPGGSLWTTGGGSNANTWAGQQDIFSNTGYYTGGNNSGNIFAGSGSPYNYWATGYGPNGTHYYENGYNGGYTGTTYTENGYSNGGSYTGASHYYENGYRTGSGSNGTHYTESSNGGSSSGSGTHYTENGYNNGGW